MEIRTQAERQLAKEKKKQREIRQVFAGLVAVVNGLDAGETFGSQTVRGDSFDTNGQIADAQFAALEGLLQEATPYARVRRSLGSSGDQGAGTQSGCQRQQATANFIKNRERVGAYTHMVRRIPMVP